MENEVQEAAPEAQVDAPAPEATETPEVTQQAQDVQPESPPEQPKETVQLSDEDHVRKRIDKIVWQREEARREAEHWKRMAQEQREQEAKQAVMPESSAGKPQIGQFENFEEYTEALAKWTVESRIKEAERAFNERTQKERNAQSLREFNERAEKTRAKYPEYDDLFERASISEAMVPSILESENGPDIVVYLGKNPDVARRLYNLNPTQAAREIGKIEAKLDDLLQSKTVTEAKPPLNPVKPKGDLPSGLDDKLPIGEWMKRRNKLMGRT